MVYTIKIDRRTIKRNPTAGQKEYLVPCQSIVTLMVKHIMELPTDLKGHLIERTNKDGLQKSTFIIDGNDAPELLKRLTKYGVPKEHIWYNVERQCEHIRSYTPEPNYLYKYLDCKVQCCNCDEIFSYRELVFDDGCDEDYVTSDRVCPECGEWDCCEVECEKLSDQELEKIIKSR